MGFITIYNGETALQPNAITLEPKESQRASFTISVEKT
jgi:hypothetical protein